MDYLDLSYHGFNLVSEIQEQHKGSDRSSHSCCGTYGPGKTLFDSFGYAMDLVVLVFVLTSTLSISLHTL